VQFREGAPTPTWVLAFRARRNLFLLLSLFIVSPPLPPGVSRSPLASEFPPPGVQELPGARSSGDVGGGNHSFKIKCFACYLVLVPSTSQKNFEFMDQLWYWSW
jgi:hypothetical protein